MNRDSSTDSRHVMGEDVVATESSNDIKSSKDSALPDQHSTPSSSSSSSLSDAVNSDVGARVGADVEVITDSSAPPAESVTVAVDDGVQRITEIHDDDDGTSADTAAAAAAAVETERLHSHYLLYTDCNTILFFLCARVHICLLCFILLLLLYRRERRLTCRESRFVIPYTHV